MALFAEVIQGLGHESLMSVVYRDADCDCGLTATWVSSDTLEFVCGRCRRNHTSAMQLSVVRDIIRDLALVYADMRAAYEAQRKLLPVGATMPSSIGAYVLGESCSRCGLHHNALGSVLALLADAS